LFTPPSKVPTNLNPPRVNELEDKIRQDVPFRKRWAEKNGSGFALPCCTEWTEKMRINRKPLKLRNRLNGREKRLVGLPVRI